MDIIEVLSLSADQHSFILSFIAGFITEDILIFLAILAGEGILSIWTVAFMGLLGMLFHNLIFFYLAKSRFTARLNKHFKFSKKYKGIIEVIEKIGRGHYFIPLLLSKFVYGMRTAVIFYVGNKEKSSLRFMMFNISACSLWIITMLPLAFSAGKGFSQTLNIVSNTEKIIGIVIIFAVLIYILKKVMKRLIMKRIRAN